MPSRFTEHSIEPCFLDRVSTRSFTGEALPEDALLAMFEAARWAPSASNVQPWRFIYGRRGTPEFGPIHEGLLAFNQQWTDKAGALVVFISEIYMTRGGEKVVSSSHAFDTGAAWMSFALQAHLLGYVAHAMGGILKDKLRVSLAVPDGFDIDAVVAVGTRGPAEALPEALQLREAPSDRRPLAESLFLGTFKG